MTQQEFNKATGLKVDAKTFKSIEAIYKNVNLDKDVFCEAWKSNKTILHALEIETSLAKSLYEKQVQTATFLIEKAQENEDMDLYSKAAQLIGYSEVIKIKIDRGIPLWEIDKIHIKNNLW